MTDAHSGKSRRREKNRKYDFEAAAERKRTSGMAASFLSAFPHTCRVQDKGPPRAQSAHLRPLPQTFRVLLFWQWIRAKVCVD
jgi:hypothetical protein